jgi:hypothetical protein
MTKRTERCETCKWWEQTPLVLSSKDKTDSSDNPGLCRRFPPAFIALPKDDDGGIPRCCHSFVYWTQPVTQGDEFCGEWTPSPRTVVKRKRHAPN